MLSREDNELLTRVGPGTPMGGLFRRFWFPILLADELPDPDSAPIRVRVLGEYYAAFRDTQGRLGLLDARCPHRSADLSMGYNEEGGLRCPRCYWKFDVNGKLLDLPMEPDDSPLWKITAPAFGIQEYGGLIWGYFGPQDETPDLPEFEWTRVEPEQRHVSRFLVECNYMQGVEAGLDSARVAALERSGLYSTSNMMADEPQHTVRTHETEYGLAVGTAVDGASDPKASLQVTHWLMPFYTTAPAGPDGVLEGVAWVPIDDESTMAFGVTYHPNKTLTKKVRDEIRLGKRVHPQKGEGTVRRLRNKENGYLPSNKRGRRKGFVEFASRFTSSFEMVMAAQESMGVITDRSHENLTENDAAITGAREKLREAAVDLMEGTIPVIVSKGQAYRVRSYTGATPKGTGADPQGDFADDPNVQSGTTAEV